MAAEGGIHMMLSELRQRLAVLCTDIDAAWRRL